MNTGNLLQEIERAAIPTEEKRIIRQHHHNRTRTANKRRD